MNKGIAQFIDLDTGEVIDGSRVYNYQTVENRQKQIDYIKQKTESKRKFKESRKYTKEYGNFIWNIYNINQQNFTGAKASDITRLMFLSTYLNYDGYLMFDNGKPVTKKNMNSLLKLSKSSYKYFCSRQSKENILEVKDDKMRVNPNVFEKGCLPKSRVAGWIQQNKYITRLYVNGVRNIYNKSSISSHKTLSYLFQILPFVNRQYNIVCFNPLEENLDNIKCMSLGDFCDTINYSKNNVRQLKNMLFNPKFEFNNKTTSAIRLVCDDSNSLHDEIFINPCIYYAGDKWEEVKVLGGF